MTIGCGKSEIIRLSDRGGGTHLARDSASAATQVANGKGVTAGACLRTILEDETRW